METRLAIGVIVTTIFGLAYTKVLPEKIIIRAINHFILLFIFLLQHLN